MATSMNAGMRNTTVGTSIISGASCAFVSAR